VGAPLPLRFAASATRHDGLPDSSAEVALVGRSNVGKSSLVNALGGRRQLAHTSKTPGRTQTLNAYAIGETGTALVDCPGLGYAQTSKVNRASWQRMIQDYLVDRDQLVMALVLVDGEIGPAKADVELLSWLREHLVPHTIVATKADKVRSSKREARRKELAAACQLEPGDVVWVSAEKGTGIDRLQDLIRLWLTP
jgi:GTP-binding protein